MNVASASFEIEAVREQIEAPLARRIQRLLPCDVEIAPLATNVFCTAFSWGKRHGGDHDGRALDDNKEIRSTDVIITEIQGGAWDDLLQKCRHSQLELRRLRKSRGSA